MNSSYKNSHNNSQQNSSLLFQIEGAGKNSDLKDQEIYINNSTVQLFSSPQENETGEYKFDKNAEALKSIRQKELDKTLQSLAKQSSKLELEEYTSLIRNIV